MRLILLDTHFYIWIVSQSVKLKQFPQLLQLAPWCLSPISFLELKFLVECGKIKIDFDRILAQTRKDDRFVIDDVSFETLCMAAYDLSWTRDPFDRLLVAHSLLKKMSLATCDRKIQTHHSLVWPES